MPIRFDPKTGAKTFKMHARERQTLVEALAICRAIRDAHGSGGGALEATTGLESVLEMFPEPEKN